MKRVPFKVAKAIKEAGYKLKECDYTLCAFDESETECVIDDITYLKPYVMDVWLWLWREKYIKVVVSKHCDAYAVVSDDEVKLFETSDPEDAIIAAIEYLVENNLIQ